MVLQMKFCFNLFISDSDVHEYNYIYNEKFLVYVSELIVLLDIVFKNKILSRIFIFCLINLIHCLSRRHIFIPKYSNKIEKQ